MNAHYPAIWHYYCYRCGLMRFLMHDHGLAARQVSTEELLAVLRMPPEDEES
jgi:hypothetical protein